MLARFLLALLIFKHLVIPATLPEFQLGALAASSSRGQMGRLIRVHALRHRKKDGALAHIL